MAMMKSSSRLPVDELSFGHRLQRTDALHRGEIRRVRRDDLGSVYRWEELAEGFQQIRWSHRADRLIVVRHGETKYNELNRVSGQHDTMLNEIGRDQALHLRGVLPPQLDLIICSALSRTVETMLLGVPSERRRQVPILVDSRLNEVNLGELQGRRRRHLPQFEAGDLDYAPRHGETYRDAAQRCFSTILDIYRVFGHLGGPDHTAAVFCHAGVLRILSTLRGDFGSPSALFNIDIGNAEVVALEASNTTLPRFWALEP
jgi:broad specificity phosphatase PhoE